MPDGRSGPRPWRIKRLEGQRFFRLLALEFVGMSASNNALWKCQCDCGETTIVRGRDLTRGHTKSCGCYLKEVVGKASITHGLSLGGKDSPTISSYHSAKARCNKPTSQHYKYYGGRGIKFLFRSPQEFVACIGLKPGPEYSLDRINNDGHYEPGNVRWATGKEQCANRRIKRIEDFTTEQLERELQRRKECH